MRSVEDARALVIEHAARLAAIWRPLSSCHGAILADDVRADLDMPPFDKALVDGYAVRAADCLGNGPHDLSVVDEIDAGRVPNRAIGARECALVMTGAPLPDGADAVVMIESSRTMRTGRVILSGAVRAGQNRLTRGREFRRDELLVPAGTLLGPAQLGLTAAAGHTHLNVVDRPSVALVTTGDEVVEIGSTPGPGQIRNSNAALLEALYRTLRVDVRSTTHVADDLEQLTRTFQNAVSHDGVDMLVATGGVSAGRRDLVPDALTAAGVSGVFHKVPLRPGKPLWFGVGPERAGRSPVLVFGLPGNPVSGLVCSLVFAKPAIERMTGRPVSPMIPQTAELAVPYQHQGDRMTFHPARVLGVDPLQVEPVSWAGSADLRAVANADGFAIFPAGERTHAAGDRVGFMSLPGHRPSDIWS